MPPPPKRLIEPSPVPSVPSIVNVTIVPLIGALASNSPCVAPCVATRFSL